VRRLGALLLAYGAASLLHFAHNAAFADAYPNLPGALSAPVVLGVWAAEALLGLGGWIALRREWEGTGLAALGLYAALGFDGLGHYALAPASAHTFTMNLTIALEALTAAALLTAVGRRLLPRPRARAAVGSPPGR
jgi:hypothetical protein